MKVVFICVPKTDKQGWAVTERSNFTFCFTPVIAIQTYLTHITTANHKYAKPNSQSQQNQKPRKHFQQL